MHTLQLLVHATARDSERLSDKRFELLLARRNSLNGRLITVM